MTLIAIRSPHGWLFRNSPAIPKITTFCMQKNSNSHSSTGLVRKENTLQNRDLPSISFCESERIIEFDANSKSGLEFVSTNSKHDHAIQTA